MTRFCDRCKNEFGDTDNYHPPYIVQEVGYDGRYSPFYNHIATFNFCPKCQKSLEKWLKRYAKEIRGSKCGTPWAL